MVRESHELEELENVSDQPELFLLFIVSALFDHVLGDDEPDSLNPFALEEFYRAGSSFLIGGFFFDELKVPSDEALCY